MIESIWQAFQGLMAPLTQAWDQIPLTYRAGGCLIASLFLMWRATRGDGEHDRMFFVSGAVALVLLAYGAIMFMQGNAEPP